MGSDLRIYYQDDSVTLIHGRWQDALDAGMVPQVDAVITDPPYSERTHTGHRKGVGLSSNKASATPVVRRAINYAMWSAGAVGAAVSAWSKVCGGWIVALTDSELIPAYRDAYRANGRVCFQPLPCVLSAMTVRLNGDGPSSWAVYAMVARTSEQSKWGTLRGAYTGNCERGMPVVGGKPVWLMRALVRDYSRPGDLILDPCAGGGTTALAARLEGRRCITIEMDEATCEIAKRRLSTLPVETAKGQTALFGEGA